jgi:CheY-like chemotaxis protein
LARKILLADDSVTAQNMGRRILSEAGYEVVTVNNGQAALKKLAEYQPHLVILDVYMPGYGGLEVCQQIKAGEETAHIPVLLTVGKLEPFKADEARRVRADGHLVKPFEASELLTILTKLEEKIVPDPDPKLQSRLAGGSAAGRSPAAKGKGFGDADSGWKERLSIPSPSAKPKLPELEYEDAKGAAASRESSHEEQQKAQPPVPGYAQLARDITAEEIAAITAAAAAFGEKDKADGSASPATANPVEQPVASLPSASQSPAAEAPDRTELAVSPEAAPSELAPVPEAVAEAAAPASAPEAIGAAINADSGATAPAVPEMAPPEAAPETDVVAALEALAPANGHDATAEAAQCSERVSEVEKPEEVPVAVGAAAYGESIQGPRWAADEVALAADEASLILEREMQKAYAVMAELNPEALGSSPVGRETTGFRESEAMPQPAEMQVASAEPYPVHPATVDETVSQAAEPSSETVVGQQSSEPPVEQGAAESGPATAPPELAHSADAVAEPPSASANAPDTPAAPSAEQPHAAAEAVESSSPSDKSVAQPASATAYAAAASAGHSALRTMHSDEGSNSAVPAESGESTPPSSSAEVPPEREAELAAAWAHWRQVRESLANPQFVSQVADATVAGLKDNPPPANSGAPAGSESASAADPEKPGEIANIVDNVLAELKPKLVEEIAKKLGKEK